MDNPNNSLVLYRQRYIQDGEQRLQISNPRFRISDTSRRHFLTGSSDVSYSCRTPFILNHQQRLRYTTVSAMLQQSSLDQAIINRSKFCKRVITNGDIPIIAVINAEIQINWLENNTTYKRTNNEVLAEDLSGIQLSNAVTEPLSEWIARSMIGGAYLLILRRNHTYQPPAAMERMILDTEYTMLWTSYVVNDRVVRFAQASQMIVEYRLIDPRSDWSIADDQLVFIINQALQYQTSQYTFTVFLTERYDIDVLHQFIALTRGSILRKLRATIINELLISPPIAVENFISDLRALMTRIHHTAADVRVARERFVSEHAIAIAQEIQLHPNYIVDYIRRRCHQLNGSLQHQR